MPIPGFIDAGFHYAANFISAVMPAAKPSRDKFQQCKVISHRGLHDNKTVFENTFAAFDPLLATGVWAIELDIRWTKDCQPIVFHDPDCQRIHQAETLIEQYTLAELQQLYPDMPSLAQLIERYGKRLHLMIELKLVTYQNVAEQMQRLAEVLAPLEPIKDFHLISLYSAQMFVTLDFLPSECLVPIAALNAKTLSDLTLEKNYAGLLGQYVFMTKQIIQQQLQQQKIVGVGFVDSKNNLYRQLNRGCQWIFSNNALQVQTWVNQNK